MVKRGKGGGRDVGEMGLMYGFKFGCGKMREREEEMEEMM